jgi:hypothetical protein
MNLFQRDPAQEAERARREAAYERGRRDGRDDVNGYGLMTQHDSELRRAYDRGRRDERARRPARRGSPFVSAILFLAACAGAFVIYLGLSHGSFAGGGQSIDQGIAGARSRAEQASRNAAGRAGDELQNAGQRLKQQSGAG